MQDPYVPKPYQPPPPPDYQPHPQPPPYPQFPPGNGPVPMDRRNGWMVWFLYLAVIIGGTFMSLAMYDEAMYGGECYTEYYGAGYSYEVCEPDYETMAPANMVNVGSSLAAFVIYIWWSYSMYQEFNTYMQREVLNPLLSACIPIFNIYAFYTFCEHLNREAALRGRPGFIDPTLTCCLIFIIGIGLPIYQSKLNEFWDMVAYQHQS